MYKKWQKLVRQYNIGQAKSFKLHKLNLNTIINQWKLSHLKAYILLTIVTEKVTD